MESAGPPGPPDCRWLGRPPGLPHHGISVLTGLFKAAEEPTIALGVDGDGKNHTGSDGLLAEPSGLNFGLLVQSGTARQRCNGRSQSGFTGIRNNTIQHVDRDRVTQRRRDALASRRNAARLRQKHLGTLLPTHQAVTLIEVAPPLDGSSPGAVRAISGKLCDDKDGKTGTTSLS